MCDPISATILVGVTMAATQVASHVSAVQTAKANEKAIKQQAEVAREETRAEATAELFDQMRAARREQGRTRAAAGEAGLSLESGSIEALLMDSAMQTEFKNDRTLANMESRHNANVAEANAALARSASRPTALNLGVQLAATAASTFSSAQGAKIPKGG